MKQTEMANFLNMIKTAYPFFEITEPGVKLWHLMLQDLEYKEAQGRLARHIRSSKYAPTIAELLADDQASEPSFYEVLRLEEEEDHLLLEAYNQTAVPMPDHILQKRQKLDERRRLNVDEH
ncbi:MULTISPECIES: replicative helicase loader/inhibitor [unclassified Paenibacillus]|uniref:replicative helicase loader/inhibitor n=2 Tax=Paenibacillus TaxID=44249 RepID=UPI002406693C|nr:MULTISPECIES: replicative helicase loader/inhibitor [unclassified Paenibacillus]MDF9851716.1 hypothetical protein [Paenibacillus sp. PastM-2]MDF9845117.1 hypothetical protein [Paenibacillus sp. PastF-2]MDF9858331.1 hypothetical protein [Paenibacillus sp. PastF-1]MDH6483589.1 hypothetical protein [Paenibacillus sp. PastH-2]MDH6511006.1 hypothetical protein [Paenibacillus sp. PastM-3]